MKSKTGGETMRQKTRDIIEEIVRSYLPAKDKTLKVEKKIVTCETCGCLIYRVNAIEGKPCVKERFPLSGIASYHPMATEHYVYFPYYCKIHIPQD
jgi:hypothetical protein